MSVDTGEIISTGFERTFKRNGLMLSGILGVTAFLSIVASQTFLSQVVTVLPGASAELGQTYPLALGMPITAAGAFYGGVILLSTVFGIGAIRTLVSSETERLPKSNFTENILMPLLNLLAGSLTFSLILFTAAAIPILPGALGLLAGFPLIGAILGLVGFVVSIGLVIYLMTALFYWNVFVIVDGQNFADAMASSWDKTEGKRLKLFAAGLLVSMISFMVGFGFGFLSGIANVVTGSAVLASIIRVIPQAFTGIFTLAAVAEAYRQITD